MPTYKLVYFDARGRAEPARMMFKLKGQDFEDVRFKHEEWPKLKADKKQFPTGQAPVLVVDGETIPQTKAIDHYLAREFGFCGKNNLEGARIDVAIETLSDIEHKMIPLFDQKLDEAKRAELVTEFKETASKPYFTHLAQLIKEAGGKYFVGDKLSLADMVVFNMLDLMTVGKYKLDGVLDPYPELKAFCKSIREDSPLKSYLETRPVTQS